MNTSATEYGAGLRGRAASRNAPSPGAVVRLPDEAVEGLRQLVHDGDRLQWVTGDYLVGVVDELAPAWEAAGVRNGRAVIIGQLAAAVGVHASTLRDRQVMAEFYPASVRSEYDMLTYHQLRACKAGGDRWREYAELAARDLLSVAKIRERIRHDKNGVPAWVSRLEHLRALCHLIANEAAAPAKLRALLRVVGEW